MLDLISTLTTVDDVSSSTASVDVPTSDIASGDFLFLLIAVGTGATCTDSTGDWTAHGTATTLGGRRLHVFKRVADGTEDANYSFSLGSSTVSIAHLMVWRGEHGTTPIIVDDRVAYTTTATPVSSGSLTTSTSADCAIISALVSASGSSITGTVSDQSLTLTCNEYATTSTKLMAGYRGQETAGAITQTTWNLTSSGSGIVATFAIAPATADGIPPTAETPITIEQQTGYVASTYGTLTGVITTLATKNINLTGTDYPAGSLASTITDNSSISPVDATILSGADYGICSTAAASGGEWVGLIETLTTPHDYDGKLFSVQFAPYQLASSSLLGKGGLGYIFADSSLNWAAFSVCKGVDSRLTRVYNAHIACNGATPDDTSFADTGSNIDWTDVKYRGLIYHRTNTSTSSSRVYVGTQFITDPSAGIVVVGGSATRPIDSAWINTYMAQAHQYADMAALQGAKQLISKIGITFGNGSTPTHVDLSQGSLETPVASNQFWKSGNDFLVLRFNGGANNVFDWRSEVFRANSPQSWILAADAGATWRTSAASWIGPWNWDNEGANIDADNCTFDGARKVKLGAGAHSLITIANTAASGTDSAAASVAGNGSLTDSSIDGTGAEYALEIGASVTAYTLTDVGLTAGSVKKVHVLATIGTVTITISGTTSLVAGDVTSAGATVVIAAPELYQSVTVDGYTTGERFQLLDTTAHTITAVSVGATTTLTSAGHGFTVGKYVALAGLSGADAATLNGKSFALTAVTTDTFTFATDTTGLTITAGSGTAKIELYNGVPGAAPQTIWTDEVAAAAARPIRLRRQYVSGTAAMKFEEKAIGTCGITEGTESISYLVTDEADAIYEAHAVDGSTVTGITIDDAGMRLGIDAGTVVPYSTPTGGSVDVVEVDILDIYAYEVYWLGTEAGIRDEGKYITAVDGANLRASSLIVGNDTSGPVYPVLLTGGYLVDDATDTLASMIDYTGGPIFAGPPHVVNNVVSVGGENIITGDIATVLAAIPSASANATATLAASVETGATVAQSLRLSNSILGGKVSGAGTGTEVFRSLADDKDRATVTVDSSGNRSDVVRDLT